MSCLTYYILDECGDPQVCEDFSRWLEFMSDADERRLAWDEPVKGVSVSTVFLAFDHRHTTGSEPVLWETMVFGGTLDGFHQRYTSEADALQGHRQTIITVLQRHWTLFARMWRNLIRTQTDLHESDTE